MAGMKWHVKDGENYPICKVVPSADGKGWVKPTIVHAQKLGLFPSITSVNDVDEGTWVSMRVREAIFRSAILPYRGGVDPTTHLLNESDYDEYQAEIEEQLGESKSEYTDDGTEVHANVARYYEGKQWSGDATANIVAAIAPRLKELGVVKIDPERTIGGPEWGVVGTPDLPGYDKDGKLIFLGDLKRTGLNNYKKMVSEKSIDPNYCLQLGGYAWLLKEQWANGGVKIDQVWSCRDTNECKLTPYKNADRWVKAFELHLQSWFLRKDYDPVSMWKERGDELTKVHAEIAEHCRWIIS